MSSLSADEDQLYIFSVCGDDSRDCSATLSCGGGRTVAVACLEGEEEVCVVREGGRLEVEEDRRLALTGRESYDCSDWYRSCSD